MVVLWLSSLGMKYPFWSTGLYIWKLYKQYGLLVEYGFLYPRKKAEQKASYSLSTPL